MGGVIELIDSFHAHYAHCIDDGSLEQWPDFFVEHCRYRITTAENYRLGLESGLIWANNRAMLLDRVSALRDANIYERQKYRHILGRPFVTDVADPEIGANTSFVVARITRDGPTDVFATGSYVDRFIIIAGAAKLISRDVVCDSSRIDTLLALPL
jgi:anthranilate 1,2-dioxygenase small subunit